MVDLNYPRGLTKVGEHTYAWMLPDGSWGWSNSGLVVGQGESLMFDTLFDLNLTREMLDGIAEVTAQAPVKRLVNSHGNGDHFYGNELMGDEVEILATPGTQDMMMEDDPRKIDAIKVLDSPAGRFVRELYHEFDFSEIAVRGADSLFEQELTLDVGGVEVFFKDLGPAHTSSDTIMHVPEDGVLYAADLLFIGGTPIAWKGPIEHWISALDYIVSLDAKVIVPGHGPLSDNEGVRHMRGYLEHILVGANAAFDKGDDPIGAAHRFDLGPYRELNEYGRVIQNFLNVYHHRGKPSTLTTTEIFDEIAVAEGFGEQGRRAE